MALKWRLSLLQLDIVLGQPDRNEARLSEMMEQAVAAEVKPDLLVIPELWNTGYALDRLEELADDHGTRTKQLISGFCKRHGVHVIAGSVAERRDGVMTNTSYVFDREGALVHSYAKAHLFRLMDEDKYLTAGSGRGDFVLDGETCGVMICYDIRFPEWMRKMALSGAKVVFVPAQWPNPRMHHWRMLLMARAIENQVFIVACNRVGESANTSFFGHSLVIDPWGEIVAEAGSDPCILTGTIDLHQVDEVRAQIPIFEDRRPEMYGNEP